MAPARQHPEVAGDVERRHSGPGALVAFVGSADLDRSRAFYGGVLDLPLVAADASALPYDAAGTVLRVAAVPTVLPAGYTVLGWRVDDVAATVRTLRARGVAFAVYDGMDQDADGVWTAPGGSRIAWFRDPDGNVLSLQQAPASTSGPQTS